MKNYVEHIIQSLKNGKTQEEIADDIFFIIDMVCEISGRNGIEKLVDSEIRPRVIALIQKHAQNQGVL